MQSAFANVPASAADGSPRTVWQTPGGVPHFTPVSPVRLAFRRAWRLLIRRLRHRA